MCDEIISRRRGGLGGLVIGEKEGGFDAEGTRGRKTPLSGRWTLRIGGQRGDDPIKRPPALWERGIGE
jgi:hypothetical protein